MHRNDCNWSETVSRVHFNVANCLKTREKRFRPTNHHFLLQKFGNSNVWIAVQLFFHFTFDLWLSIQFCLKWIRTHRTDWELSKQIINPSIRTNRIVCVNVLMSYSSCDACSSQIHWSSTQCFFISNEKNQRFFFVRHDFGKSSYFLRNSSSVWRCGMSIFSPAAGKNTMSCFDHQLWIKTSQNWLKSRQKGAYGVKILHFAKTNKKTQLPQAFLGELWNRFECEHLFLAVISGLQARFAGFRSVLKLTPAKIELLRGPPKFFEI